VDAETVRILAAFGFVISVYAIFVKIKKEENPSYRPWCDISEHISCTKAFSSDFGKVAGLPNPVYGLLFYGGAYFLPFYSRYFGIAGVLASVYLAYASYFRQKNFCVVCTAIYIVNILLLLASF